MQFGHWRRLHCLATGARLACGRRRCSLRALRQAYATTLLDGPRRVFRRMGNFAGIVPFQSGTQVGSDSDVVPIGEPWLAETGPPSPCGLRRGSLRTRRERRLVGDDGIEPPTAPV